MLVTDSGQLIRFAVDEVRIAGRRTQGVTLFRIEQDERVVSVAHLSEVNGEGDEEETKDPTETSGSGEEATERPGGEEE